MQFSVGFSNRGSEPCTLPVEPARVRLVTSAGKTLVQSPPSAAGSDKVVVLPPGVQNAAWLIAYWGNWCASPPGSLSVGIAMTDKTPELTVALPGPLLPRCDAPGQKSSVQIDSIAAGGQ